MGHYSEDADSVRVDFFKPSGKWIATDAVKWTGPYHGEVEGKIHLLPNVFRDLLGTHLLNPETGRIRHAGMTAVCLEPYHEHEHPLMTRVPGCTWCGLSACPGRCAKSEGEPLPELPSFPSGSRDVGDLLRAARDRLRPAGDRPPVTREVLERLVGSLANRLQDRVPRVEHFAVQAGEGGVSVRMPVQDPEALPHTFSPVPSDCGERGGGNQPPGWTAAKDPAYLASVRAARPQAATTTAPRLLVRSRSCPTLYLARSPADGACVWVHEADAHDYTAEHLHDARIDARRVNGEIVPAAAVTLPSS